MAYTELDYHLHDRRRVIVICHVSLILKFPICQARLQGIHIQPELPQKTVVRINGGQENHAALRARFIVLFVINLILMALQRAIKSFNNTMIKSKSLVAL